MLHNGWLSVKERTRQEVHLLCPHFFGQQRERKRERHTGGNIGHDRRAIEIDKRVMQKKRGKYLINIKCHCYVFLIFLLLLLYRTEIVQSTVYTKFAGFFSFLVDNLVLLTFNFLFISFVYDIVPVPFSPIELLILPCQHLIP